MERQIRYNVETNFDEQNELRHTWTICIINEPREIGRITQRFADQLSDSTKFRRGNERYMIINNDLIEDQGIHYRAFTMKSNCGELPNEDKRKIYDRLDKFKKDRDLTPDKNDVWFGKVYIPRLIK
jgi:hypothetical protein